jgi:membrane protease YdiL (CAAX protease family)
LPLQLGIGLVGIGLGIAEYLILILEPLISEVILQTAWLPALVLLLYTGFVEEFVFRGILQKAATDAFGGWGIVYVSFLFAMVHIGWICAERPLAILELFSFLLRSPSFLAG